MTKISKAWAIFILSILAYGLIFPVLPKSTAIIFGGALFIVLILLISASDNQDFRENIGLHEEDN